MRCCIFLIGFILASCAKDDGKTDYLPGSRSFYMGFTAFPYDDTAEAQSEAYRNVAAAGDIFLNRLDHGIPWNEALNDLPFPESVQYTLNTAKIGLKAGTKILLSATAMASDHKTLAKYWNDNGSRQPLPETWQNKTFDDPDVISAYFKYCKRIIESVNPDYFAYGMEVNAVLRKDESGFSQYRSLVTTIYSELKVEFPDLPIFLTFQDRSFTNSRQELLENTTVLLQYSDYIAMSTYPFLNYFDLGENADPKLFPNNWLRDFRELDPAKPFAISETGFCAENLIIDEFGVQVKGTEQWQDAYLEKLFSQGNFLEAEFITWFIYRDYDLLYEKNSDPTDSFRVWRDTGLLDGSGNHRAAYETWMEWKALEKL